MTGIILDTNVISEPRRAVPDKGVAVWIERQDPERLFLTATVLGELAVGASSLPAGRRREALMGWVIGLKTDQFRRRILPYDEEAALVYGELVAGAAAAGRIPQLGDAQIAAVASRHGHTVATRDVAGFAHLGVEVIDPWEG